MFAHCTVRMSRSSVDHYVGNMSVGQIFFDLKSCCPLSNRYKSVLSFNTRQHGSEAWHLIWLIAQLLGRKDEYVPYLSLYVSIYVYIYNGLIYCQIVEKKSRSIDR